MATASYATETTAPQARTGCPYGRPECGGLSGLYLGELSCLRCYLDASEDAREHFEAVVA